MRIPALLGLVVGLLVGALAVVLIAAALGPGTIEPARSTPSLPGPTTGAIGSSGPTTRATATSSTGASGSPAVGLQIGATAPSLRVPQVGGGNVDLVLAQGKPVWVAFTASWCPSCRDELGLINRAKAQFGEALVILVIDVKEDPDTAASLVSQTGLVVPMGVDRDGAAQKAWNAFVLPIHFWVDRDSVVRAVLYGSGGPTQFARGIATVLPGATFKP